MTVISVQYACTRNCLGHAQAKALKHIKDTSRASEDLMGETMPKRLLYLTGKSSVETVLINTCKLFPFSKIKYCADLLA